MTSNLFIEALSSPQKLLGFLAALAFLAFVSAYVYVIARLLRAVRVQKDNFYLFLRVRLLVYIELVCNLYLALSVAFRQVRVRSSACVCGVPCVHVHAHSWMLHKAHI